MAINTSKLHGSAVLQNPAPDRIAVGKLHGSAVIQFPPGDRIVVSKLWGSVVLGPYVEPPATARVQVLIVT